MAGRLEGKVAFITGAARGQGRTHAIRLAQEGADIIAVDVCADVATVPFHGATEADLAETVKQVEALDRRIVATRADVRDFPGLVQALDAGVAELGRLDIVAANAGIVSFAPLIDVTEEQWQTMMDVNLTGVWHTVKAAAPHLIAGGNGGSIILTASAAGLKGTPNLGHYVAAKHGVNGMMKTLALELARHSIRVNSVNPGNVNTDMVNNEFTYRLFMPDVENPTREDFLGRMGKSPTMLPAAWAEPEDISAAVAFLASDDARFITGVALPVDLGAMAN
jgi:SDR family mycofactocin-dependent oxidoreductase